MAALYDIIQQVGDNVTSLCHGGLNWGVAPFDAEQSNALERLCFEVVGSARKLMVLAHRTIVIEALSASTLLDLSPPKSCIMAPTYPGPCA